MDVTTILLLLIGITYSVLTLLGAVVQLKEKKLNFWATLLMIIGGLLISASIFLKFILENYGIYMMITGLILIHISAIDNGYKMFGKINPKHHIIRLCISIVLIVLYVIK